MKTKAIMANLTSTCLLCSRPADVLGCFEPHSPHLWPFRRVWYRICRRCLRAKNLDRVEERLMELTSRERN
jgi:hypothetical protein